jgi:hypothetical protein
LATGTGNVTITPVNYLYVASGSYDTNNSILTRIVTSTTVPNTSTTGNAASTSGNLTVADTANLLIGYPIQFTANAQTIALNSSDATGNLNVSSVSGLQVDTRIQVSGNLAWASNLTSGNTYFVRSIDTLTSNIKLSNTFGGAVIPLAVGSATSNCTGIFGNIAGSLLGGLNSANTYYLVSKDSLTGNITLSNNLDGAPISLIDENGYITAIGTTDYVINVTLGAGTVLENDPVVFSGNIGGGLVAGQVYYACNVSPTAFSVSQTRNAGVAGQKLPLTVSGNTGAIATFTQGTAIWKRTQLNSW